MEKIIENKGKMEEYKKILNGRIEYSYSEQTNKIEGFIKLSKDPQNESFNNSNIIPKSSILTYTDWFFCFVLLLIFDLFLGQ